MHTTNKHKWIELKMLTKQKPLTKTIENTNSEPRRITENTFAV